MSAFDAVPRIERVALIARAMEIHLHMESDLQAWAYNKWPDPDQQYGLYKFNPYTNAAQSQNVQERLRIFTIPFSSTKWKAMKEATKMNNSDGVVIYAADTIRDAIADCAARWQWEKEREGK